MLTDDHFLDRSEDRFITDYLVAFPPVSPTLDRFALDYLINYPPPPQKPDNYQSIRFAFDYDFNPVITVIKDKVVFYDPDLPEDSEFIWNSILNREVPEYNPLPVDRAAERLHELLKRKSSKEENFRKKHISVYQGTINKEVKKLISDIYNYGYWSVNPVVDTLSYPRSYPRLEATAGLWHCGSIYSHFYDPKDDCVPHTQVDGQLEFFQAFPKTADSKREVVIVKLTTRRILTLANLAAEKVSECLSDRQDLAQLTEATRLPAVCSKLIEECL